MLNVFKKYWMICLNFFFLFLGLFFALLGCRDISIATLIFASVFLLINTKNITNNYINFTTIFILFHILYGLSGIISKAWINQFSSTYGKVFIYCPYLVAYSLCTICLLIGMIIANRKKNNNKFNMDNHTISYFKFVSFVGLALTSIFELINFLRVGGFETLLAGKAIYQAKVDELILTLPSQYVFQVSIAAYFIYLISIKKEVLMKKDIILPFLIILPYILIIFILGRRGPILALVLTILIVFYFKRPLKKISYKIILVCFVTYLLLSFMFVIRNDIGLLFKDFGKFKEKYTLSNTIKYLNPALSEFGCTYGNFNKLYVSNDYDFLYGKSYIEGLVHFIPSYFYPGNKPRMITYEFRDKYFQQKAEISSIASTGFSSIMETYWNFGYFGCVLYGFLGYIIIYLEKRFKTKNCFSLLWYFSIATITYSYHRSDFGHTFYEFILVTFEVLFIYVFNKYVYNKFIRKEIYEK